MEDEEGKLFGEMAGILGLEEHPKIGKDRLSCFTPTNAIFVFAVSNETRL